MRQNILFTAPYEAKWYKEVVKKCCMESDLELFAAGDMTEIGEKGVNLSGGQKQRISLARAVYQRAGIYLLDDPLSAVDAHVSSDLFDDIIGPEGLLKGTTRILVTHSVTVLPFVDKIFVLDNGKITNSGTFQEIMKMEIPIKSFLVEPKLEKEVSIAGSNGQIRSESRSLSESSITLERATSRISAEIGGDGKLATLIDAENVATGSVKWSIYMNLWRHFGAVTGLFVLLGLGSYRFLDVSFR